MATVREYDSSGRQAAARQRRERVLAAAVRLFGTDGWARTTIASVAKEAGVSPELVRRSFGSKAELFMDAYRQAGFGDHPDLQEAFDALTLLERGDVEERLDQVVAFARDALVVLAPLLAPLHQGAAEDDRVRELLELARRRKRETAAQLVRLLQRGEEARPEATDLVYVLTSGETFAQFVEQLGWSPEQYAAWLRGALDRAVNG